MNHNSNELTRPGRIHEITAVSNPRIKSIRALSHKKYRDRSGSFLVEGLKLVRDAHEGGWKLETLIYSNVIGMNDELDALAAKVRITGADVLKVNEKVLSAITRKDNPQMVLAVVRQSWAKPPVPTGDPKTVWVALDRVRDPGNLGTIIRTAESTGADGIILVGDTTDPFSLEAARASMGSIFHVPIARMSVEAFLKWRETWSGKVIGTHLRGAVDYRLPDYSSQALLLMMGNEQHGLPEPLAEACDQLVYIPMHGSADSLNLGVATGVMLFHIGRHLPPLNVQSGVNL